jgi:phage baseplate assembly protein W
MLSGWKHVEQSIRIIFATPYHERILERWVGSFVPRLLGESVVPRVITRHYWAMGTAIEHWEPRYKIKQIFFMGDALSKQEGRFLDDADVIRVGQIFVRPLGVYFPRGHLGDFTPFERRAHGIAGKGSEMFDVGPSTPAT